jgi:hypothetical protein
MNLLPGLPRAFKSLVIAAMSAVLFLRPGLLFGAGPHAEPRFAVALEA